MAWKWFLVIFLQICNCHEIKIVDGVDKKGERGSNNGLQYHEPDLIYGPEGLFFLNGVCFTGTADRYEYSVCPFQNITQRRLIGSSATLLGVWGQWNTNETHQSYDSMLYSNGQTCGRKGRSVQLGLLCGHPTFEVISTSITEISTCEHGMILALPIACSIFTRNILHLSSSSEPRSVPLPVVPDFKKSHSTGPSQYTPPQSDVPHEATLSSNQAKSSSQVQPSIVTNSSPEANASLILSLKQQISDLQNTLNAFLTSAGAYQDKESAKP